MKKHNDLIPSSPCNGTLYIALHGLYENFGWTLWKCLGCGKTIRQYPKQMNIPNKESKT